MRESYFEKNLVADDESDQSYDGEQHEGPFDNGFFEFGIAALILLYCISVYLSHYLELEFLLCQ